MDRSASGRHHPNEHTLTKVKKNDSTWVALGGTRWTDPKIYTSYTYSRIALGEAPSKVLSFTRNESSNLPEITVVRNATGTVTLSWPKSDETFALQSAQNLTGVADVSGVQEAGRKFIYTAPVALIKSNYYRLRQLP